MLVDMSLNILFEVPPAFLSVVTCVFKFSFRVGRHIIDIVLAEIIILQSLENKLPITDPLGRLYVRPAVLVLREIRDHFPYLGTIHQVVSCIGRITGVLNSNRSVSYQIVLQLLIASCGCHRRHQLFGSDNISKRDLGYSQTSLKPFLNAFYVARPFPETQLRGIHIFVGLFPVSVVP